MKVQSALDRETDPKKKEAHQRQLADIQQRLEAQQSAFLILEGEKRTLAAEKDFLADEKHEQEKALVKQQEEVGW